MAGLIDLVSSGEIPKDYIAEYKVPSEIPPAPKPGPQVKVPASEVK